jgi:tetratricopeptide (TPR) repeat protein
VNVYPFIYSFVADHFQYLAGIGVIVLGSAGAAMLWERLRGWRRWAGSLLVAAVLLLLVALTWSQCGKYIDAQTLYAITIKQNPGCWMAYNNLGLVYFESDRVDESIGYFQKALALKPDFAKPENNLGLVYYQKGKIPEAVAHFQKALELRPDLPEAHNDLANVLYRAGHLDEAISHYQMALKTNPNYAAAMTGLGNCYYAKGDLESALREYQQAIDLQPGLPDAQNNIGNTYLRKGMVNDAISHYQEALKIDPGYISSLNSLAWLFSTADSSVRNGARAVELASKANELAGGKNAGVLGTLAAAYAETGRFPEAVNTAEQARRMALAAKNNAMVNELDMQLQLYRAGSPYHQSSR